MRHVFPARWKAQKLDKLGFVGRGRSRQRPRNEPSLYGGEYPFFQTGDIKAANLYLSEYSQTYNEKGLAQSKQWEPGTLCITIAANIADTAILGIRGCFPDSVIGFISDPAEADVHFIKYYIDLIKLDMQQVSHGTTQDNLSIDKLLRFDFVVPDVEEQRKIAAILSAYDDLIENNLRRIKILEEMAQNLYCEWFVKFRFPGHQHTRFVDSPLGQIPEGWEVTRLGEILELNYGKALKKEDRREGNVPVYGSSGVVGYHDVPLVNGPGIVVGRKGNVGSVYWSDENFYPIDTAYFVISKMPLRFLFYDLQTKNFLNNDAAVPGLNRNQAYSLETVTPPADILTWFCQFADDFERQAAVLRLQNTTLRRTRDLLLPRLISGEVDVSELDIAVPEEAAA
jgi:type I restriction enzyme S subunit